MPRDLRISAILLVHSSIGRSVLTATTQQSGQPDIYILVDAMHALGLREVFRRHAVQLGVRQQCQPGPWTALLHARISP